MVFDGHGDAWGIVGFVTGAVHVNHVVMAGAGAGEKAAAFEVFEKGIGSKSHDALLV
jgi:hypothetical protein